MKIIKIAIPQEIINLLKKVKPLMDDLRQKGFFMSEDLYQDATQKAGEWGEIR